MIPRRSQFGERRLPARERAVSEPELYQEMENTFLKMCDLLEQYAPLWYSDPLRQEAQAVLRHMGK